MKENIEEDINYLDSMVKEYKQFGNLYNEDYEDEDRIYQALDHILSDYKRVLKENEECKRNYEILKYDIQDKRIVYIDTPEFEENYIPVQKVKDKIEELKHKEETDVRSYGFAVDTYLAAKTLQELLESEE